MATAPRLPELKGHLDNSPKQRAGFLQGTGPGDSMILVGPFQLSLCYDFMICSLFTEVSQNGKVFVVQGKNIHQISRISSVLTDTIHR